MSEHDLLHHCEAESSSLLMGGEVRLENLQALSRGYAGSVVSHVQKCFRSAGFAGNDMDFAAGVHRLNGIEQEVKERLPEQLLIGFHR